MQCTGLSAPSFFFFFCVLIFQSLIQFQYEFEFTVHCSPISNKNVTIFGPVHLECRTYMCTFFSFLTENATQIDLLTQLIPTVCCSWIVVFYENFENDLRRTIHRTINSNAEQCYHFAHQIFATWHFPKILHWMK